ncbi:MAG: ROK family protein [Planctomycetales bacterium]
MTKYCLGIEIGGSKLQLGLGEGRSASLQGLWRASIDLARGAEGIRERIVQGYAELLAQTGVARSQVAGAGIAFGGPVNADQGMTVTSHQVHGWDQFPLAQWCQDHLGLPASLQNDADTAALAEALFGAGQGFNPVMYLTVGSGIGGGLILGGKIYRGCGPGALEIGHLRPGQLPRHVPVSGGTVESIGSGFGITQRAQAAIDGYLETAKFVQSHHGRSPHQGQVDPEFASRFKPAQDRFARLWDLCGGDPSKINTQMIAQGARDGDRLSLELFSDATSVIGWAIAQAITLVNPGRVVIGGGVSLIGEELFFAPVRRAVAQHVFGPFAGLAEIVPAALQEEVVVYGAVAVAADAFLKS